MEVWVYRLKSNGFKNDKGECAEKIVFLNGILIAAG